MKAMVLSRLAPITEGSDPLSLEEVARPSAGAGEVLVRVEVCGVCHTELDEIEGRLPPPDLPVIPGHQAVGRVLERGPGAELLQVGDRVGVAWIFSACGVCDLCVSGQENLCASFRGTGLDADGGYAQLMTVPEAFAHPIPDELDDVHTAPLLCAGAIGFRSLRLTGIEDGQRLGLTGFGASGHLVLKMVRHRLPDARVFVFARDPEQRAFARDLGAVWAGDTSERTPEALHAIIDTTPVWKPVVEALANLAPGGRLVINAIRKESVDQDELLRLDYPEHLWMEREIKSVANVTRRDVSEFLELAGDARLRPQVEEFPLTEANEALRQLKRGGGRGAKVLRMS